jgi:hypothetical protein
MYIIAKKKDYYDGVAGTTGIDKTIVYERLTNQYESQDIPVLFEKRAGFWGLKRTDNPFHALNYHSMKKENRDLWDSHSHFIIGFCGKLYIGWKLYKVIEDSYDRVSTTFTYDVEYMKDLLEEKSWEGNFSDCLRYVQNYDAMHIFRDLWSPIFVYDSDFGRVSYFRQRNNTRYPTFIVNPLLKDYAFFKVFDAVQAFQEVQMFMGGVLGRGEKDIVEVEDKYKIAQHGFDKWSFRKEPENKK